MILFCSCEKKSNPQLKLLPSIFNYGKIQKDSLYKGFVVVKNIGGSLLKIENVSADCGCTNIFLSKNEIQPGDTCTLDFTYNTFNKEDKQENFIFIQANTDSLIHVLQINAYVK